MAACILTYLQHIEPLMDIYGRPSVYGMHSQKVSNKRLVLNVNCLNVQLDNAVRTGMQGRKGNSKQGSKHGSGI